VSAPSADSERAATPQRLTPEGGSAIVLPEILSIESRAGEDPDPVPWSNSGLRVGPAPEIGLALSPSDQCASARRGTPRETGRADGPRQVATLPECPWTRSSPAS
jgi:hypothetical protein